MFKLMVKTIIAILRSKIILLNWPYAFLFLDTHKMLVIIAEIHKMLVRMANREDPDQTAS